MLKKLLKKNLSIEKIEYKNALNNNFNKHLNGSGPNAMTGYIPQKRNSMLYYRSPQCVEVSLYVT